MKENTNNRMLAVLCAINTVALLAIGLGISGVNVRDLLSDNKIDSKSASLRALGDRVVDGEIISSYEEPEEATVVTMVEIESAMQQLGELTTVAYNYSGVAYESDCSKLFGWEVGFTRNSIEVDYDGTIRAGYVVEDIAFDLDQENRIITVTLPNVQVFSNEITDQEVGWDDNVFNHIDPDIATELIAEAKDEELDEAIENGLYREAESNAEEVIGGVLAELCDYEVVFSTKNSTIRNNV